MYKMFVMTHKKTKMPAIDGYVPLLLGACEKEGLKQYYQYTDDQGMNISAKNPHYCELTGMYWIWKNVQTDCVGVCHYRRFFLRPKCCLPALRFYLREKEIYRLLKNCDIILPKARTEAGTIPEIVNIAPNRKDLDEMYEAIKAVSPQYLKDYETFLAQNQYYMYNMMICRKEIFDAYCTWLFPILQYIEERHDMSLESRYRQRLYGFLSERLLYVWLHHNIPENRRKEVSVANTDESPFRMILHEWKNQYRAWKYRMKK